MPSTLITFTIIPTVTPDMDITYDACYVRSSGEVRISYDGIEDSYGRIVEKSPSTSDDYGVGYAWSSGGFFQYVGEDSYGISPNSGSLKEYDEICMNPDGFVIYCNITLSYGRTYYLAGH